jgi:hypothetical protein
VGELRRAGSRKSIDEVIRGCVTLFSIEEIHEMLDDIATELPEEIFNGLNGGVSLLPEIKKSTADPGGGLYTLGEYRRDQMGRYIVIYYGSIQAVHGRDTPEQMRANLKRILTHELTHHVESLAGERDLEIQDEIDLDEYLHR